MEVLKDLKVELRKHRGSIKRISEQAECSAEWVHYVLNGTYSSEKVLTVALLVLEEMRQEARDKEARRNALFSQVQAATAAF